MNITTHRSSTVSRPRQLLTTVRDELRERRETRAAKRQLQRDLATYSTRAEVDDLMALLHHQDSAQADQIRGILNRNLQQGHHKLAS
jgi:DNA replication protein DnaD